MARIVVIGGSLIGLATATMVAKLGHDVTVLERDPAPPPDTPQQAWDRWERQGVMQFRQPHYLLPAGQRILGEQLPEAAGALVSAGAVAHDMLSSLPPGITDRAPRPGDKKFLTRTARRPVLEYAMAKMAERYAEIRRGARVTGLLTTGLRTTGARQVTGVVLHDHAEIHADLVIDAMGRASPLPVWLEAAGLYEVAERAEFAGFTYYSRLFRARPGEDPPLTGSLTPFDCYSILTIPSDAGTWAVTIAIHACDRALRKLREERHWTRLAEACPLHAHLVAGREPVTGVLAASGGNRIRAVVRAGVPVATGVLSVGDAWACTGPSLGRGVTLGLMHAAVVAEAVADHVKDPFTLAIECDRLTRQRLLPWYRNTVYLENQRAAQIEAVIEGRSPQEPDPAGAPLMDLLAAMTWDADVFRAYLEMVAMLAPPQEIMSRPGLADKISGGRRDPWRAPGPSRGELLKMLW